MRSSKESLGFGAVFVLFTLLSLFCFHCFVGFFSPINSIRIKYNIMCSYILGRYIYCTCVVCTYVCTYILADDLKNLNFKIIHIKKNFFK